MEAHPLSLPTIIATLLLGSVGGCIAYHRYQNNRRRLPPGPPGLPFVGNIFDIPKENEWKVYRTWGTQLASDIICLDMAGTPMVVLNSKVAVHDLLDKKSAIYSDRPRYVMLNELCGFSWDFNFQGYGKAWKDRRKLFAREMQPPKSLLHRDSETRAIHHFLHKLIHGDANNFVDYLRQYTYHMGAYDKVHRTATVGRMIWPHRIRPTGEHRYPMK
ncbi:hypothetical protein HYPSUDRAFT_195562 [Hypholoma sublateritium FD-334 SS-4]|uniref:Cytochrome P450 n=1 Tax=Hypholoma sublateritium (strain FD-334 SS-4) TaxID=945553 RepID=A0A0D2N3C3_HYPSF|nr:hypothetical protein HYPSUDRAFT_195562 [Hypholoma sublateritium FD-334 SS-4]